MTPMAGYESEPVVAKLLREDKARRIAANVAD